MQTDTNRTPVNLKLLTRFFSKIKIDPNVSFKGVPCWLWTAGKDKNGYGKFSPAHSQTMRAQRFVYEAFVGVIDPPTLHTDHLCRVHSCVNPVHLEAVPPRVNTMRGEGPAAKNVVKTHCPEGHEYTEENTRIDSRGRRSCKECSRIHERNHPRKRAEYQRQQRRLYPERYVGYRKTYQDNKSITHSD